jgi:DNA-binding response OmpR family regulator
MARVLVVEDDLDIAPPLVRALSREGHEVDVASTGAEALRRVGSCDLVLLDVGLPDRDGLDVCREIRSLGLDTPVLMLTARTTEADIIVGLDAGADDYLTKPFRVAEMQARVRALLRRRTVGTVLHAADVSLDLGSRRVTVGGVDVALTRTEASLLVLLLRDAGLAVTRERMVRDVWGGTWPGAEQTIDVHMSSLRRKLNVAGGQRDRITTLRGIGYRFEKDQ